MCQLENLQIDRVYVHSMHNSFSCQVKGSAQSWVLLFVCLLLLFSIFLLCIQAFDYLLMEMLICYCFMCNGMLNKKLFFAFFLIHKHKQFACLFVCLLVHCNLTSQKKMATVCLCLCLLVCEVM